MLEYTSRFPVTLTSPYSFKNFPPTASQNTPSMGAPWGGKGGFAHLSLALPPLFPLWLLSASPVHTPNLGHKSAAWCWDGVLVGDRELGRAGALPQHREWLEGAHPKSHLHHTLTLLSWAQQAFSRQVPILEDPSTHKVLLPHHYSLTNVFSTKRPPQS